MKNAFKLLVVVAFVLVSQAHAGLIWDYSPQTGDLTAGSWGNISTSQNFADVVSFPSGAVITGYVHFTSEGGLEATMFRFKMLADDNGQPGALLQQFDLTPDSFGLEGTFFSTFFGFDQDIYRASFTFPGITLAPGVKYWVGMSGVSVSVGQAGVQAPGDGLMAQFSGTTFAFLPGITGDQSFQLDGTLGTDSVPEPATFGLIGLGLLSAALAKRIRLG